jgi:hypothetical protein
VGAAPGPTPEGARPTPGAAPAPGARAVRYATLPPMLSAVLLATGLFATAYGCWRGYTAARSALAPLVRDGDPTRTLVESAQPIHARGRVRLAARSATTAVVWLAVAMYGLYLSTVGLAGRQ